ncbi:nuclear apoptosis-inducing factor 1-like [Pleurodeles waltl]|uniref:nuclear apoptosis-inducing factor 1-like n=1 Tax=Pleurodeles waltl TaxID=8319 RepID=UPI0037098921
MSRSRKPCFSERELRVMVDEIMRVAPQLLGAQVQHTSFGRKMEMWVRIVDRVNAVGPHIRTRNDIRKRWNDLRGKVRNLVSRHQLQAKETGGGLPSAPLRLSPWEEKILPILHSEDFTKIPGGLDSGQDAIVPTKASHQTPSPPLDEALSVDNSTGQVDVEEPLGISGLLGQTATVSPTVPTTPPSPVTSTSQTTVHLPTCVPRTVSTNVFPPVLDPDVELDSTDNEYQGTSGSGHPVPRAQACEGRMRGRDALSCCHVATEAAVSQDTILGVYQKSQGVMSQILSELQEMKQLQRDMHRDMNQHMEAHNDNMASLTGVLRDIHTILSRAFPPQSTPSCSPSTSGTTSAAATGREALPEAQPALDTPASVVADAPPRKRGRPSKTPGRVGGKTPTTASKHPLP